MEGVKGGLLEGVGQEAHAASLPPPPWCDPGLTPQVLPVPCWLLARSQIPVFPPGQTFKGGKEGREKGEGKKGSKRMEVGTGGEGKTQEEETQ